LSSYVEIGQQIDLHLTGNTPKLDSNSSLLLEYGRNSHLMIQEYMPEIKKNGLA